MKLLPLFALLSMALVACSGDDDTSGGQQPQTGTGGGAGASGAAGASGSSGGGGAAGSDGGAGVAGTAGTGGAAGASGAAATCPDPTPPPESRQCVSLAAFQAVERCKPTRQQAEDEAAGTCPSDAQRGECGGGVQSVWRTISFTGEWIECFYDASGALVGGVWASDHGPLTVAGRSPACTRTPACPGGDAGTDVDCSVVGCGMPPVCSVGCQEPCGCCTCNDGEPHPTDTSLVCAAGCWAPAPGG